MNQLITILSDQGVEILSRKSIDAILPLSKEDIDLIIALKEFIVNYHGLGMSAIQLGVPKNIFVMKKPWNSNNIITVVNPKILRREGTAIKVEACFSVPTPKNTGAIVRRAKQIFVQFDNEAGELISNELFIGMDARVFQHEFDHLQGQLMTHKDKFQGWDKL